MKQTKNAIRENVGHASECKESAHQNNEYSCKVNSCHDDIQTDLKEKLLWNEHKKPTLTHVDWIG